MLYCIDKADILPWTFPLARKGRYSLIKSSGTRLASQHILMFWVCIVSHSNSEPKIWTSPFFLDKGWSARLAKWDIIGKMPCKFFCAKIILLSVSINIMGFVTSPFLGGNRDMHPSFLYGKVILQPYCRTRLIGPNKTDIIIMINIHHWMNFVYHLIIKEMEHVFYIFSLLYGLAIGHIMSSAPVPYQNRTKLVHFTHFIFLELHSSSSTCSYCLVMFILWPRLVGFHAFGFSFTAFFHYMFSKVRNHGIVKIVYLILNWECA